MLTLSQLLPQHLQLLLSRRQGDCGRLTAAKEGRASGAERQEAGRSRGPWGPGQANQHGYGGKMKA